MAGSNKQGCDHVPGESASLLFHMCVDNSQVDQALFFTKVDCFSA